MTIEQIEQTLPPNWKVYETHEGKYIFVHGTQKHFSWEHPDPNVPTSHYGLSTDIDGPDFQPKYEALSYAWGSQSALEDVFVKDPGDGISRTLLVGSSVVFVLRHLRHDDQARDLWIDSICINQIDNVEKSHQVSRMNLIYTLSYRVIAWLGPENNESGLALSTIDHLAKQLETTRSGRNFMSIEAGEPTWWDNSTDLPFSDEAWEAITCLLERLWFERLWVVQEIFLANRLAILQCGYSSISWSDFRRAIICLRYKKNLPSRRLRELTFHINPMVQDTGIYDFNFLLWVLRSRFCSDPRDKIYGLLGIAPPGLRKTLSPDYSLTAGEVYKDAFLSHVRLVRRWEIFSSCWGAHDVLDAPSWVPNLAPPHTTGRVPSRQLAAGHSGIEFTYRAPDTLEILGLKCATVVEVRKGVPIQGSATSLLQAIQSWAPVDKETKIYPTGESFMDAFAVTLRQNNMGHRFLRDGEPTLDEWRIYVPDAVIAAKDRPQDFDTSSFYATELIRSCYGRDFISTSEGYIGLGPIGVSAGDIICVFLGCEKPVVLRPEPEGHFLLVGDSFVYGLNDTRAFLGPLPKPWIVQIKYHPRTCERFVHYFFNSDTGESTAEDPRLSPDPDWERINLDDLKPEISGDIPEIWDFFRHRQSGQLRNSDPRLSREALEARGVKLRKFAIK